MKKTVNQKHFELLGQLLYQMDTWYERSVQYQGMQDENPNDHFWGLIADTYLTAVYELEDIICEIEEKDLASIKKITKKYMDNPPWDE